MCVCVCVCVCGAKLTVVVATECRNSVNHEITDRYTVSYVHLNWSDDQSRAQSLFNHPKIYTWLPHIRNLINSISTKDKVLL